MHYRSVEDLNRAIVARLHLLPRDLELIVGIPRSGLLAANLVALHLNLPLTDLGGYLEGRLFSGGARLQQKSDARKEASRCKALIIDDSVQSGFEMRKVKERVQAVGLASRVVYACVFVDPSAVGAVDFYFEVCPMPRIFEWNMMHHGHLKDSCMDIDGVLCRDPSETENDDGPRYAEFIRTVAPLTVPTVEIGWLVTCRLEKYRGLTVEWLARQGIHYRELIMMNYPDKSARLASGGHASFKASVYRAKDAVLFIESSRAQATEIVRLTGRDVFCTESREMIHPDYLAQARRLAREPSFWPKSDLGKIVLRLRGRLKLRTRLRRCMGLISQK